MKISLHRDETEIACTMPYDGAKFVVAEGACPQCKCSPYKIQGGETTHDFDTYRARAWCVGCGARAGELRVTVSTLFGIDEDEAVLHGRARVY